MEQKIREGLEQIRPFLQRDGGDIKFVEYTKIPSKSSAVMVVEEVHKLWGLPCRLRW